MRARPVAGASTSLPRSCSAAVALLAAAACAHGGGRGEALPARIHAGLRDVLVFAAAEGVPPLTSGELVELGLDVELQAALRDAVIAEARRAGAPEVRAAEARELEPPPRPEPPPPALPPAIAADGLRSNLVGAGEAVPVQRVARPRPAPGTAWIAVRVVNVELTRGWADDDPVVLQLEAVGTIEAAATAERGGLLRMRGEATRAVVLADVEPRPPSEWRAEGGKAVRTAVEGLVSRAARRIAAALLGTADDGSTWSACGPEPRQDPDGERVGGEALELEWSPWRPLGPDGRALPVRYDLRAWRVHADGSAEPIAARDGLARPAASISGLAPGATYAWTVRGVAELSGGRALASPWSHPHPEVGGCAVDPDPVRARRFTTERDRLAPATPAREAPASRIVAVYGAEPQAGGARIEGREVAKGMGGGAAGGALAGLQASSGCGPLFPVCAVFLVPAGLVFGTALGGVGGAIAGYRAGPAVAEPAGEPVRSALAAALRRGVQDPAFERRLLAAANSTSRAEGPIEIASAEVRLVPIPSELRPAYLRLTVTGRRTGADGGPDERTVQLDGVGPVLAHVWLEDGAALLSASLPGLADRGGARLAEAFLAPPPPPPPPPPPAAEAEPPAPSF